MSGSTGRNAAADRVPRIARRHWLRLAIGASVGASAARVVADPRQEPGSPLVQHFGPMPGRVERVFAAGPPAAVLLAVLAPDRLLGWPMTLAPAALDLLPAVLRIRPVLGRLAGRGSTVKLESLLALAPDLVLDAGTVDANFASGARRVAESTGLPVALVDGRLADSAAQLRAVGRLVGAEARGERLALEAASLLADARAAAGAGAAADAPGVYLARGADGLETATAGSINAEVIGLAGGRNVAETGRPGIARVSLEQVLAWSPRWIVTQDPNFVRRAAADPVWRTLPAIREGRLLFAPSLPFGWLDGPPAVNRLLGVAWLADRLQAAARGEVVQSAADRARSIDIARRFHDRFYGVVPRPEDVARWLDGAV